MSAAEKGSQTQLPDLDTLDVQSLKALVLAKQAELDSRATEIESLKLLIAKLKRMHFGPRSEKRDRDLEQLELRLEELEANQAAAEASSPVPATAAIHQQAPRKPARRPLPAELPRETETIAPAQEACPDCGGALRRLGEDVTETLEYVPARFKVIRKVRPKLSCAGCSRIVQAPAPNRPIDRGLAGPGLLAHVLVAKYADHQPLYRQATWRWQSATRSIAGVHCYVFARTAASRWITMPPSERCAPWRWAVRTISLPYRTQEVNALLRSTACWGRPS